MDHGLVAKRYKQLGGKLEEVRLPTVIRANTLRMDEHMLVSRLMEIGVQVEKIPYLKYGYKVVKSKFSLGAITEFLLGYYYIQESASQLPVQALYPEPGELVLDMAASPGGKTTQLAQWMQNKGAIIAVEKANFRIQSLKSNLERCGATNCLAYNTDALKAGDWGLKFDKILLDAPCSGNYVTDRSWIQKRTIEQFKQSGEQQRRLLGAACRMLKKTGTLVYSTCSLEPEEDELVVDWALRNLPLRLVETNLDIGEPGLTNAFGKQIASEVKKTRRLWPNKTGTQGFFIARFERA